MTDAHSGNGRRWLDPDRNAWEVDLCFRKERADQPRLCFSFVNERGMKSSVPYVLYPRDVSELTDDEVLEHWLMLSVENPGLLEAVHVRGSADPSPFPTVHAAKLKDTSLEATRSAVREGLYELADLLDAGGIPSYGGISSSLAQLWYHIGNAEDDHCTDLISRALERLSKDLSSGHLDRSEHVTELRVLADSVWARWCV